MDEVKQEKGKEIQERNDLWMQCFVAVFLVVLASPLLYNSLTAPKELYEYYVEQEDYEKAAFVAWASDIGEEVVKSLAVKAYDKYREQGEYGKAAGMILNYPHGLGEERVREISQFAYEEFLNREDYQSALKISVNFLERDKVIHAAGLRIQQLSTDENFYFYQIKQMVQKYNLPPDILTPAAERHYKECMQSKEYVSVLATAEEYNLGQEKIQDVVPLVYEEYMNEKNYLMAEIIAENYNLGQEKIERAKKRREREK